MELQDKELEKAICYKIGEFGDYELQREDLLKIEELNLNNRTFSGKEKDIDLREIQALANLKNISLQYFRIDDSIAEILNSLGNLNSIYLASCEIDITKPLSNPSLKSISFEACNVSDYSQIFGTESFRVIGDPQFRLKYLGGKENIERMFLQQCKVKNFESIAEYTNLQVLNLDGSTVDDEKTLKELQGRIQVSKKDEYLPIR